MSTNIFEFPPVERKYVAVRRYIITIGGEKMFNKLLNELNLTREEFTEEYGESLIGNPNLFSKELAKIIRNEFRSVKHND